MSATIGLMALLDTYLPDPDRYDGRMPQRRCGDSGLTLPAVSLGFWHNFGDDTPLSRQRAIMRTAFDVGITFRPGQQLRTSERGAEINVGRILREDFSGLRDELIISTKAGWDMWPGPYGFLGSRKYLMASLDQSLQRLGWTMSTSSTAIERIPRHRWKRQWERSRPPCTRAKRSMRGSRPTPPSRTRRAASMLADMGVPLLIHQPSYSMLNRWIEDELLDTLAAVGSGCIGFSPLAQGMLTGKYLHGIPEGSRASRDASLDRAWLTEEYVASIRALQEIADARGQSIAQMAVAWTLRDPRVTSTLIGASSVEQLLDTAAAVRNLSSATRNSPRSTNTPVTPGSTSGKNRRSSRDRDHRLRELWGA